MVMDTAKKIEIDTAKERLKNRKAKKISLSDLQGLLLVESISELFDYVNTLVSDGALTPIKASGRNGNLRYQLYEQYRITLKDEADKRLSEVSQLHPSLLKNGYLAANPSVFLKNYDDIRAVSAYLFRNRTMSGMSKKERSFDIFGEEKRLDDSSLMNKIGATPELLCYYETPEYCFNDYIPERKRNMVLLICENKDIWFNIRRRMFEDGASTLFGCKIDGVVYGSGEKASGNNYLTQYSQFMGAENVSYLYWGDIDRAGLTIFQRAVSANPAVDIRLFVEGYRRMLQLAAGRRIPNSDDKRGFAYDFSDVYALFSDDERGLLAHYIEENKRVPQEIVNYEILLGEMM